MVMVPMTKTMVLDIVPHCFSYEDGRKLRLFLSERIKSNQHVILDFSGVYGLPSSFVNGAFADLLEEVSFSDIKKYVSFSSLTKQSGHAIKERLIRLSEKLDRLPSAM